MTPSQGTVNKNQYECTDGYSAWCAHTQECYSTNFMKGDWAAGCRVPDTAPQVTGTCGGSAHGAPCHFPFTYKNKVYTSCTSDAHDQPWCSTTKEYEGKWGNCECEAITCSCMTPSQGTVNKNQYECTDGYSAWCAHTQECYSTNFVKGDWAAGCRVPDTAPQAITCSC